jgi:DNA-binding CsgD family transcriptional regulator
MENIKVPKNYVSLSHANDFSSLCQPLLANTNIAACHYARLYRNGGYFHLASDTVLDEVMLFKWRGKYHYDVRIMDITFGNMSLTKGKNKICMFTKDIDNNNYWTPLIESYNISNSFNIIEKFNDYHETFWFASRFNKTIHVLCMNHYDVLENFTLYFKEVGNHILKFGEKNKIIWNNNNPTYCKILQKLQDDAKTNSNDIAALKAHFSLKKHLILNGNNKAYLTSRELECLQCFGRGFSYKEIGNILKISDRTVETHLQHIKHKLDICTSNQLLRIYHSQSHDGSRFKI